MKIAINRKPVDGPWGGGNIALKSIVECLQHRGHDIVFDLHHNDIDRLVCFDPRTSSEGLTIQHILSYRFAHKVPLVCRVGDVGTHGKPDLTTLWKQVVSYADATIYISRFARDYIDASNAKNVHVIHNAPDSNFYTVRRQEGRKHNRRIVTHHWSTNPLKGFPLYEKLNEKCAQHGYQFTYVGRYPQVQTNVNRIGPLAGQQLADELLKHDVYFTASKLEAGGMHPLEAMAVGLPVVYTGEGGGYTEICDETYGCKMYDAWDIDQAFNAIQQVFGEYDVRQKKVLAYHVTIDELAHEYADIIEGSKFHAI